MDVNKITEVLKRYMELFYHLGCRKSRQMEAITPRSNLGHAAWMTREALKFVEEGNLDKANRWLGFIQGVLWCHGVRDIDQMRHDNMSVEEKKATCTCLPGDPSCARCGAHDGD